MSLFGKAWRVLKGARRALAVFADVGVAVRSIVRGDVGKVLDRAAEIEKAVDRAEEAAKRELEGH